MNSLVGHPLNRVLFFLNERHFDRLWRTGDKILQSRIRNYPLVCEYRPHPYSNNVIGLSKSNIVRVCDEKVELGRPSRVKDGWKRVGSFTMSPTIATIRVTCYNNNWNEAINTGFFNYITDLHLILKSTGQGELLPPNFQMKFPPALEKFTINRDDLSILAFIPLTVKYFHIKASVYRWNENPVDLTHLELETYRCNGYTTKVALPITVTRVQSSYLNLVGNYPLLTHAEVRSISGFYPLLEELLVERGDLSGCTSAKKVIISPVSPSCIYTSGVLEVKYGSNLRSCMNQLKDFTVTYIKWECFEYPIDDLRIAMELFPTLQFVSFRVGAKIPAKSLDYIYEQYKIIYWIN